MLGASSSLVGGCGTGKTGRKVESAGSGGEGLENCCCWRVTSVLIVLELASEEAGGELGAEERRSLAADTTLSELLFRDLFTLRTLSVDFALVLETALRLEVVLALEDLRLLFFFEPLGLCSAFGLLLPGFGAATGVITLNLGEEENEPT